MRLIDADALLEILQSWRDEAERLNAPVNYKAASAIIARVERMPTIEEQKTGKWIDESVMTGTTIGGATLIRQYRCSVCGNLFGRIDDKFCGRCGARMEENNEV